jgi:glycosyltransferase involved in cell wall biosynthesis
VSRSSGTKPLVSIGLPTYNGARFLNETLHSILTQDLEDFELLISDNGSTDATEQLCREASRDPRVHYERSPENRGAAWNYNRVLERASGSYFKWAADDDLCAPTFLRACAAELDRSGTRAVLAWPRTILIDEAGGEIDRPDDSNLDLRSPDPVARLSQLLHNRFEWHPVFGLIRTEMLKRTSGIGAFVLADVALLAELALAGEFHQVPEPLFLRRYHEGRSLMANASFRAHAAWYDPSNARQRAVLPNGNLVRELLRRTANAPLSRRDQIRAAGVVLRDWALPHWRHIGGEVKRALPIGADD